MICTIKPLIIFKKSSNEISTSVPPINCLFTSNSMMTLGLNITSINAKINPCINFVIMSSFTLYLSSGKTSCVIVAVTLLKALVNTSWFSWSVALSLNSFNTAYASANETLVNLLDEFAKLYPCARFFSASFNSSSYFSFEKVKKQSLTSYASASTISFTMLAMRIW